MNPFKILGVHRMSTDEEIASAYKVLAQTYHPDRGGDARKFNVVNEAYRAIKDKKSRRRFLESLYMDDKCYACQGRGVTWKSKGLTEKVYQACPTCGGAGYKITEYETLEEEDDVIKL